MDLRRQVALGISQEITAGRPFVVAILAGTSGSTYLKSGERMLVRPDGSWVGMLSGGCLEPAIADAAIVAMATNKSKILRVDTTDDMDVMLGSGVGCKGVLTIALIPFAGESAPRHPDDMELHIQGQFEELGLPRDSSRSTRRKRNLVVFGAGVDVKPVCRWASDLEWNVIIIDPRPFLASVDNFPDAHQIIVGHMNHDIARAIFQDNVEMSFVLVMTHNFNRDIEILKILSHYRLEFVGILGPLARTVEVMRNLSPRERAAIAGLLRAPMGLSLGGYGPESIALSVLAQLQAHRYHRLPESRSFVDATRKPDVIILAAGTSSRMGSPKQLLKIDNETLVKRAVTTAAKSMAGEIYVVVGSSSAGIRRELDGCPVTIVENPQYQDGIASSIVTGIRSLPGDSRAALIMTCDQPLISEVDINQLLRSFVDSLSPVAAMAYGGTIGVPAIFDMCVYPELMSLKGNTGAKSIIHKYSEDVATYACGLAAMDCDTPEDLRNLHEFFESMTGGLDI